MSDMDFDLDAILAEFSDETPPSPAAPRPAKQAEPSRAPAHAAQSEKKPRTHESEKKPRAAEPEKKPRAHENAPQSKAHTRRETASEEPTRLLRTAHKSRPRREAESAKPQPEQKPRREVAKPQPEPAKPRPERKIRPKAPEKQPPAPPKRESAPRGRYTRRSLTALGIFLTAIALGWLMLNVHPGSSAASAAQQEDLSARVSAYLDNHRNRTLGGPEAAQAFVLSETAPAPAPDPSCYGTTDNVQEVQAVIDRAALLLDGQTLAWDPTAEFLPGSPFRYYLDDSIFVLCWKEIIDGKCCSCAEVKIADGSQLRRKLADDSYGSEVQLYATQLAREANAVVAINGDFYAFRGLGITVYQGKLYRCDLSSVDSCFFTQDGDMLFAYAGQYKSEDEVRAFIEEQNVRFSLAFGPVLVDNGEVRTVASYPVGEIDHYYSRSSIGQLGKLHYLLMTVNYEGEYQHTCTTMQSGRYMLQKGCQKAYSLDGGQTSIIVLDGQAFNRVDWNSERSMSDIVYFASAVRREGASA